MKGISFVCYNESRRSHQENAYSLQGCFVYELQFYIMFLYYRE